MGKRFFGGCVATLVGLGGAGVAMADIAQSLAQGGEIVIREKSLEPPYKTSKAYSYARGAAFDRWTYNPWLDLKADPKLGITLGWRQPSPGEALPSWDQERGFASADITASTRDWPAGSTYQLRVAAASACHKAASAQQSNAVCRQELTVRCYGYVKGKWTRTIDETRVLPTSSGKLKTLPFPPVPLAKAHCDTSLAISFKVHIDRAVSHYQLADLTLSLKQPALAGQPKPKAQ